MRSEQSPPLLREIAAIGEILGLPGRSRNCARPREGLPRVGSIIWLSRIEKIRADGDTARHKRRRCHRGGGAEKTPDTWTHTRTNPATPGPSNCGTLSRNVKMG